MPTNAAFGRRASPQTRAPAQRAKAYDAPAVRPEAKLSEQVTFEDRPALVADAPSLEDELREWKKNRRFEMPWRQISLMASLCFGIASLVLPDTTNDAVNWLLYGLMAISFVAGISRRRKRAISAKPV